MPKLKLTKTSIDNKAISSPSGDVFYWDITNPGFGLKVTPKGVKVFVFQGRVRGTTKDMRFTLGTYGAMVLDSPDPTRNPKTQADLFRHQLEQGIDPREVKKQREAEKITLQQVMEAYVGRPGALKPKTAEEYRRNVEVTLAPWADKPITSITREMVLDRHKEVADHGLGRKGPAPASANSAMRTLRILLNFAMDTYRQADGRPIILENPVGVMKRHWRKEGDRSKRNIPDDKIGEVWVALDQMRETAMNGDALAAIDLVRLALTTGCRKNELAALTWDRVNLDDEKPENCSIHLPDPKNGVEVFLPLSGLAVGILKQRPRVKDKDGVESPYVFASRNKQGYIGEARAPLETVTTISGKHLSLHDARRTFTGIALRMCRIEKFRVDLLTNHQPPKSDTTTRNYFDTTNLQWLHGDTQKISDHIEAAAKIAAAKQSGANVVALIRA